MEKFKFLDYVKIIDGFYVGYNGRLLEKTQSSFLVELETYDRWGLYKVWIDEAYIERRDKENAIH